MAACHGQLAELRTYTEAVRDLESRLQRLLDYEPLSVTESSIAEELGIEPPTPAERVAELRGATSEILDSIQATEPAHPFLTDFHSSLTEATHRMRDTIDLVARAIELNVGMDNAKEFWTANKDPLRLAYLAEQSSVCE